MSARVSVILPVYNGAEYIRQCLDSISKQTYSGFEIIVIDDCSTDKSREIISMIPDTRIRYYRNEENYGIVYSLNRALSLCEGEYIARMDADDICEPNRLEKQVQFLENNQHIGLVSSWFEMFGDHSGIIKYATDPEKVKCRLLFSLQLLHPGWMMRRSLITEHGLYYREDYKYAEDWDFLVRASRIIGLSNIDQVLMHYRTSETQISYTYNAVQKQVADQVARDQLEYLGLKLTAEEFDLYRRCFGHREVMLKPVDMRKLMDILVGLDKANQEKGFYSKAMLRMVIGEEIYWLCYYNLMNNGRSGLEIINHKLYRWIPKKKCSKLKLWLRAGYVSIFGK